VATKQQQKKHSNTEFRKKNSKKKFGEPGTFSGSKFDPATSVTPVLVTNNNNQAILRIEKRSRQELPSLMAENGNACTTYAYLSPTPVFFAPFYYGQCLRVCPALSAIQMRMMVA
jgi:hypothetical protein